MILGHLSGVVLYFERPRVAIVTPVLAAAVCLIGAHAWGVLVVYRARDFLLHRIGDGEEGWLRLLGLLSAFRS